MLSVLIPVYNFNVVSFVKDLDSQCISCDIEYEIICLDDFSDQLFRSKNNLLTEIKNVTYEELSLNVGRSKIRNLLAQKSKYEQLLFLDCDSKTIDSNFISNYISKLDGKSIIYGGRSYANEKPENEEEYFRWWYGVNREIVSVKERRKDCYGRFMTNNFLIPKEIFLNIKLDESLKGYGHEDTLFGIELKKRKIPIIHIHNPLCHIGLENFEIYMKKTEEGISNLNILINNKKVDRSISLFNIYNLVRRFGLESSILFYFTKNKNKILTKIKKERANLRWFDFYKLAYLASLRKS